uniref:receptor protein-tyrosine kinase n=1 Tax=Eptatretus burgeri TaxID=7764 RepID=A0A8C4WY39_EPTBU
MERRGLKKVTPPTRDGWTGLRTLQRIPAPGPELEGFGFNQCESSPGCDMRLLVVLRIPSLLFVLVVLCLNPVCGWLQFLKSPTNQTLSSGVTAELKCLIKTDKDPRIYWLRDELLFASDSKRVSSQVYITYKDHQSVRVGSTLKFNPVRLSDIAKYQCVVKDDFGLDVRSSAAWLTVEGLPFFVEEPRGLNVTRGAPFSLACKAIGPPQPVSIVWHKDGNALSSVKEVLSPSVLNVDGIEISSSYSCHARNSRGITVSRTAWVNVKELPHIPNDLTVKKTSPHSVLLSWSPGFDGFSPLHSCSIEFFEKQTNQTSEGLEIEQVGTGVKLEFLALEPYEGNVTSLAALTQYQFRVACENSIGLSQWSPLVFAETTEGVPSVAPENVTFEEKDDALLLQWSELPPGQANGILLGYRVLYWVNNILQASVDIGQQTWVLLNVTDQRNQVKAQVEAYTASGAGPRSHDVHANIPTSSSSVIKSPSRGEHNGETVLAVLLPVVALTALLALATVLYCKRRKDTFFGSAFSPMADSEQPLVWYRVKKSYCRTPLDAALHWFGFREEFHDQLQDVMVDRARLSLGKELGEGEFGSVIEGKLRQSDGAEVKVAVKTMKMEICTRVDMENFLNEAVRMKEFDHPNVLCLLGVCMELSGQQQSMPRPMVILPFMRHGDLHSFLLSSRLGETPVFVPLQTLVKFMVDVAQGMEYLSSKNFIHRDLAARNCMLHEDMVVCVADFGLSKKIYSGDYYRQGQISKMPVKWIALESMADRLYTTKSDVWAYGVTMWEIITRGKMPYPGVQNHEMYDYLLAGNRLNQPPDCLDDLYCIMQSCWCLDSTKRPSFSELRAYLQKLLKTLPSSDRQQEIVYANTGAQAFAHESGGCCGNTKLDAEVLTCGSECGTETVSAMVHTILGNAYKFTEVPEAIETEVPVRPAASMVPVETFDEARTEHLATANGFLTTLQDSSVSDSAHSGYITVMPLKVDV